MELAFVIIWLLREIKAILFWLFLWQLKEYRLERFLDHFRTAKGKKLLLDPFLGAKIFSFAALFFEPKAMYFLVFLYATEIFLRRTVRPVFTKKALALFLALLGATALFAANVFFLDFRRILEPADPIVFLLAYDILTPFVVTAVVLALQPFTIIIRNRRLAQAKAKRASFPNLKVIGITGSYGKTSTKEFLAYILAAKFNVLKTPEHQNSEFGVAHTILNKLSGEHEVFVCEMGAYKKGEIKALAQVAQPHIGIVTGVNEQHLATFGSMKNLLSAEGGEELAEALPEKGVLFINQNAKIKNQSYNAKCKIIAPQVPYVRIAKDHISFELEGVSFRVPVYGGHNGENLSLAIAAARELGMSLQAIAEAAKTMPLELSPLKIKKGKGGTTVIDSTYSANPDGVLADLDYLGLYEGKKVLVMPCLIELGPAAKEAHRRIGKKIAEVCDLAIITTKEHFTDVKEGAGGSDKVMYMENVQRIKEKAKDASAILLESRLPESLIKAIEND